MPGLRNKIHLIFFSKIQNAGVIFVKLQSILKMFYIYHKLYN